MIENFGGGKNNILQEISCFIYPVKSVEIEVVF